MGPCALATLLGVCPAVLVQVKSWSELSHPLRVSLAWRPLGVPLDERGTLEYLIGSRFE